MMNRISLLLLVLTSALPALATGAAAPKTLPGGWVLAWHDEFNGSKLDAAKWQPELGVVRNQGAAQTYTADSISVKDGMLTLTTKAEETPVSNYKPGSTRWTGSEFS